ncbi:MAG: hypothetical protein ACRCZI_08475 [Cetobacterium sp.]
MFALPHDKLFYVYISIVVILVLSLIYHFFIYRKLSIPYATCEETDAYAKKFGKYLNSSHLGLIRGIVFGILLDQSAQVAVRNGAINGIVNPLITAVGLI